MAQVRDRAAAEPRGHGAIACNGHTSGERNFLDCEGSPEDARDTRGGGSREPFLGCTWARARARPSLAASPPFPVPSSSQAHPAGWLQHGLTLHPQSGDKTKHIPREPSRLRQKHTGAKDGRRSALRGSGDRRSMSRKADPTKCARTMQS